MKHISLKENHLFGKAYAGGQKYFGRFTSVYVLRDRAAHRLMKANPEGIHQPARNHGFKKARGRGCSQPPAPDSPRRILCAFEKKNAISKPVTL